MSNFKKIFGLLLLCLAVSSTEAMFFGRLKYLFGSNNVSNDANNESNNMNSITADQEQDLNSSDQIVARDNDEEVNCQIFDDSAINDDSAIVDSSTKSGRSMFVSGLSILPKAILDFAKHFVDVTGVLPIWDNSDNDSSSDDSSDSEESSDNDSSSEESSDNDSSSEESFDNDFSGDADVNTVANSGFNQANSGKSSIVQTAKYHKHAIGGLGAVAVIGSAYAVNKKFREKCNLCVSKTYNAAKGIVNNYFVKPVKLTNRYVLGTLGTLGGVLGYFGYKKANEKYKIQERAKKGIDKSYQYFKNNGYSKIVELAKDRRVQICAAGIALAAGTAGMCYWLSKKPNARVNRENFPLNLNNELWNLNDELCSNSIYQKQRRKLNNDYQDNKLNVNDEDVTKETKNDISSKDQLRVKNQVIKLDNDDQGKESNDEDVTEKTKNDISSKDQLRVNFVDSVLNNSEQANIEGIEGSLVEWIRNSYPHDKDNVNVTEQTNEFLKKFREKLKPEQLELERQVVAAGGEEGKLMSTYQSYEEILHKLLSSLTDDQWINPNAGNILIEAYSNSENFKVFFENKGIFWKKLRPEQKELIIQVIIFVKLQSLKK